MWSVGDTRSMGDTQSVGDTRIPKLHGGAGRFMAVHLVLHFVTSIHVTCFFGCHQMLHNLKSNKNSS